MAEYIDRAVEVMHDAWKERGKDRLMDSTQTMIDVLARALDAAGRLVTPEHDRAVEARALRDAAAAVAYAVDWDDPLESVESWLCERAARIEAGGPDG